MKSSNHVSKYNLKSAPAADMPQQRTFTTIEEEREYLKRQQVACLRLFSDYGYDTDIAGHFAVRDPEYTSCIWVNPLMVPLSMVTIDDLVLIDHNGEIVHGKGPVNLGAYVIHSRIHKAQPDIVCSVHFHSQYGKIWSSFGRLLDPINQDACAFYGKHVIHDIYRGVPQSCLEGDEIALAMADCHSVILKNHGLLTTASSVAGAAWRFVAMERACHGQLIAEASAFDPIHIPPNVAKDTQEYLASEYSAWLSFQPILFAAFERYQDI